MLGNLPQGAELLSILPQLLVAALAMIVLLVDALAPKGAGRAPATVSLVGLLVALGATLGGIGGTDTTPVLGGMVISDRYAQFFNLIFLGTAIVAVLLSMD